MTTIQVEGAVSGIMWWPAVEGYRQTRKTFNYRAPAAPFRERVDSIREAIERTASEDGDFQTAGKLTGDSLVIIRRQKGNRTVERVLCVSDFPNALADYVNSELFIDEEA